ncbi:hypothetical protein [Actinokineospora enzanensis]|uniref:hypothetical protein n=1 Tax=Actinokineospora enzanensis TaxID=155975 RepID=UPI00035D5B0C|nr:hypothetical protein [Actinokineospora enzanensis]
MGILYGPSVSVEQLTAVHDLLTTRGWTLDELICRENGYPVDPEARWCYPDSFGGVTMHVVSDVTPYHLTCRLDLDDEGGVVIGSAGNYLGCDEHTEREHRVPGQDDKLDLEGVAAVLDRLEPHARALNPRDLIECRFFGPCGENNDHL